MGRTNPISGIKRRKPWEKKWFAEVAGSGPPFLAAVFAAVKALGDPSTTWLFWPSVLACVWLLLASILKVVQAKKLDAEEDLRKSHDGLTAALSVLHSTVCQISGVPESERSSCLRATFHRVVPPLDEADHIEQIVPYVGGRGNGEGRKFPIRSGITGQAVRDKSPYIMNRTSESYDDYKKELVSKWHYTEGDVKAITSDRFSAMAVPMTSRDGQHVIGVVYLDSSNRNFFGSEVVYEAVLGGCAGITRYTGERYV